MWAFFNKHFYFDSYLHSFLFQFLQWRRITDDFRFYKWKIIRKPLLLFLIFPPVLIQIHRRWKTRNVLFHKFITDLWECNACSSLVWSLTVGYTLKADHANNFLRLSWSGVLQWIYVHLLQSVEQYFALFHPWIYHHHTSKTLANPR